jgi:monoamine oxidase
LSRRELGFATAQLGATALVAGCAGGDSGKRPGTERVAVVGCGIAGVHCAYRLMQSGVSATLYEASPRVGGRMFTARDDAYDGQVFELGGELIDSNHATLMALAEELGIQLDDRLADESIQADVWFVAGEEVPEATIVEQFTELAPLFADAVAAAEEDDDAFAELDNTALAAWLEQNVPSADYPELHAVLDSAYRGEFGLETSEQSALNLLYLIDSEEPDPFRIFGDSDERYHARQGSDSFVTQLAERLPEGTIVLGTKLVALRGGDDRGFTVVLQNAKTKAQSEVNYDHVVLAIPFSVLREVELDVPLSDLKRQIIDELGYGTNAKVMGSYEKRVWREEHQKSGSVTSDLPLQQTWDSSIGQPGSRGILTNFLGGQAGVDVGERDPEQYYTGLLDDLDAIFPGTKAAYLSGTARRMHWPSYEHTRGSYTCYKPGQWSFWEQEGLREGNLHFCGEHTSADFQGWMEGGAETGAFVAAEVLEDLGLEPSPELSRLLAEKLLVRQAQLTRSRATRASFRERRQLLRAAHRARSGAAQS